MDQATAARFEAQEAALLYLLKECSIELPEFAAGLKLSPAALAEVSRLADLAREQADDSP